MARDPAGRQAGSDPDYRFSLANERTFLAWVRTALAVLAAGVLFDQFSTRLHPQGLVLAVATLMCALAAVLCGMAYGRWRGNEIAMRLQQRLPHSRAMVVLAGGVFVVATFLAGLILLGPRTS